MTKLVAVNFPNNPTGYVPDEATFRELVALCDERGIRLFCDEVYRGIEVDPARTHHAGRRPLGDGALAQRHLQGLRPPRPARRLARLPRPRAARAPGEAQALHHDLQRGARRSTSRRSRSATGSRSGSATAASSPPTGRCSTTSSPAGRSCSTGSRRSAAASASRATRAATSRTSVARLLDAEGVLVLPASMYYSEIAEVPSRPLPRRNRQARPRRGSRRLRPLPPHTGLNSLQEGDFGPPLSVTCCPCQRL